MPTKLRGIGRRLSQPAYRLIAASFVIDVGAASSLLGLQFKAIALQASPFVLGLLGSAHFWLYPFVCLISGVLSDRFGRRAMAVFASVLCIVSWAGMAAASQVWQLLALVILSGVGLAWIWPPVEAWLADLAAGDAERLNRHIGLFNIAWTAGLMLGPLVAGQLWESYGDAVFVIGAGTAVAALLATALTPSLPRAAQQEESELALAIPAAELRFFLLMAWTALGAAVFARGLLIGCFPKLGASLGYSPALIGRLLFVLAAGQGAAFLATRYTLAWRCRLWAVVAPPVAGLLAFFACALFPQPAVFAVGFALTGAALGLSYTGGITYALQVPLEARGRRMGIHEGIMGWGLMAGPFFGGLAGQRAGLIAPLWLAATIFATACLGQSLLWSTYRRKRKNAPALEIEISSRCS